MVDGLDQLGVDIHGNYFLGLMPSCQDSMLHGFVMKLTELLLLLAFRSILNHMYKSTFKPYFPDLCMTMGWLHATDMESRHQLDLLHINVTIASMDGQFAASQPLEWQDHCCFGHASSIERSNLTPTLELDGMYQLLGDQVVYSSNFCA